MNVVGPGTRMSVRTFGVEEELLLVDAEDGHAVPAGGAVFHRARALLGATRDYQVEQEFKREQTEIGSTPCTEAAALRAQLIGLRRAVAEAAKESGAIVAALGTSPFEVRPEPTRGDRYRRMLDEFGVIARQQLTCGQHIHVGISSPDEGVGALDRMARWLPVITALSANSPFWQGQDTGYASFRTIAWGLWPTAGPCEPFGDINGYRRAIDALIASGTALDDGMIYFDARLSAAYPTVEIRVADVCTDVRDAVLVSTLARGLVDTTAREWELGIAAPEIRVEMLHAASWRAARSGISGDLLDPQNGRPAPAWSVVKQLVRYVEPALAANGDLAAVREGLERLRLLGSGAERQRREFRKRSELLDVVVDVVRRTLELEAGP